MRARKRFGQHFLEPAWVRKVVEAIAPAPDDVFLEIGPGRGALTLPLAAAARLVIGIEVDRDLAASLPSVAPANVRVVTADVLSVHLANVLAPAGDAPRIRVAGNLPYNISSPILFRLLELQAADPRVTDATLMLQKEVVDRLIAEPGTRDYGVLAVLVGRRAQARRVLTLPPGAFRPPPEVTSAVVRLDFRLPGDVMPAPPIFEPMVRGLFTQRRKTTANALAAFAGTSGPEANALLQAVGIDPRRRPETLSLQEFVAVAGQLEKVAGHSRDGSPRPASLDDRH